MRRRLGLRCQNCGFNTKTLYGVEMKFEMTSIEFTRDTMDVKKAKPVTNNVAVCRRCLKKFGLIKDEPRDE